MQKTRDLPGKITAGSTDYPLRLATSRPTPYRPAYRAVWPESQEIPGRSEALAGDPLVRSWVINEFSSGEGDQWWQNRGRYYKSAHVRPSDETMEKLVVGPWRESPTYDDATPAVIFAEGTRLGFGHGKLWAGNDNTIHWWQTATDNWDATGWATGAGGSLIGNITELDATTMLVALKNNTVRYVQAAANGAWATGFTDDPVICNVNGVVYALDRNDLYDISTGFTTGAPPGAYTNATLVWDSPLISTAFYTNNPNQVHNRITPGDAGPIWYERGDNGQTWICEYAPDAGGTWVAGRVGRLPVDYAFPYTIYYSNGFIFVGFRYSDDHQTAGDAYLYYQRGSQRGVAGPIRSPYSKEANYSHPVAIGGVLGNELIISSLGSLWGYNFSTGGIVHIHTTESTNINNQYDCRVFGKDIFLSNTSADSKVERWDTTLYTDDDVGETCTWESGWYDFGYPGVKKTFLSVTVKTAPIVAADGHQVNLAVSTDGGSTYTAVTGDHNTNGATTYTWTLSTSTTSTTGYDLGIRLTLNTDEIDSTPQVYSVTARAISAEKQRSWVLELDPGPLLGAFAGRDRQSAQMLANYRSIIEYAGVVKFTNPWDGDPFDSASTYDVVIEEAVLVEDDPGMDPYVAMRLREVSYV